MIAHDRTVDDIADELDCDSLAYLSLDGVYAAVEGERAVHCDACFSGDYPLPETETSAQAKDAFERALPLVRV
jgi:amidophosphoribosyltransferase